jgi:dUTP pyrophosphatase
MNIQLKELVKGAMFTKGTDGSAAYDLKAMIENSISLKPNENLLLGTGIALNMSGNSVCALILPRSGLGVKGLVLGNLVGLIDSDYQGEIKVSCWNRSSKEILISPGMRIAQLLFTPVIKPSFEIVDDFANSSTRKEQGFGHTGF